MINKIKQLIDAYNSYMEDATERSNKKRGLKPQIKRYRNYMHVTYCWYDWVMFFILAVIFFVFILLFFFGKGENDITGVLMAVVLFGGSAYYVSAFIVNKTHILVSKDAVLVKVRPLPFGFSKHFSVDSIKLFFYEKQVLRYGYTYHIVSLRTKHGDDEVIISKVLSEEYAVLIVQSLMDYLKDELNKEGKYEQPVLISENKTKRKWNNIIAVVLVIIASMFLIVEWVGWSESTDSPRGQAHKYFKEKKYADAIVIYDQLLGVQDEAKLRYWRAVAHKRLNHTDEALHDFRRVIELDRKYYKAYLQIDRILSHKRQWDDILDLWAMYIEVTPDNADAYYERGGTNYNMGDYTAAHADAQTACKLGKSEACRLKKMLENKLTQENQ